MSVIVTAVSAFALQQATPQLTPTQDYMFCVWSTAKKYSVTQETAPIVVDAAATKCAPKRMPAIEAEISSAKAKGSPLSSNDLRRIAEETLDEYVKAEGIRHVVEKRAEGK